MLQYNSYFKYYYYIIIYIYVRVNIIYYIITFSIFKWRMKCITINVFNVACSFEHQKERDISHVYRQWKMIVLLWLPSNRSESFIFLLIFSVSASMHMILQDYATRKHYKKFTTLTRAYNHYLCVFTYVQMPCSLNTVTLFVADTAITTLSIIENADDWMKSTMGSLF